MGVQALLVDDEPLLSQYLQAALARQWPELQISGVASHGAEALRLLSEQPVQVVFLDIQMPQLDGLALAKVLSSLAHPPLLVFVTAFEQYALPAIEQEAVDYLLKPVQEQRLALTVARLKKRLQQTTDVVPVALPPAASRVKLQWIKAMKQDTLYLLAPQDIRYFQAEDKYTTVVTADAEYLIRTPIKELREQLDPQQFVQVRRGTLVNSQCIDKVQRDFSGRMYVCLKHSDVRLLIGRSFVHEFRQM
jgi:DNA-binding LytR/AlgR family response regulator